MAADLQAVDANLHLTRATYQLDSVTTTHGTTTAAFTAHDTVAGVGAWTYHSSFTLVPGHDGPTVAWSRAVINPRLGRPRRARPPDDLGPSGPPSWATAARCWPARWTA